MDAKPQPSTLDSNKSAFFASLDEKIRHVADDEKAKIALHKKANSEYVQSDPLGLYEADGARPKKKAAPKDDEASRRASGLDGRPQSQGGIPHHLLPPKRKKQGKDDIFTSFGKEQDKQAVSFGEDGKLKVNYQRFEEFEMELERWHKVLGHNGRHDKLLMGVRKRGNGNFVEEMNDLKLKNNSMNRQKHAVPSVYFPSKSTPIIRMQELQQKLAPAQKGRKGGVAPMGHARGRMSLLNDDDDEPVERSFGEEQILSFVGFVLSFHGSLEKAFRKIDGNGSNEVSFGEWADAIKKMGFRGDAKFIFHKLDKRRDGGLNLVDFLQLRPYMLKEMLRVIIASRGKHHTMEVNAKSNIWFKMAQDELTHDEVLREALEIATGGPLKDKAPGRSTSADSRSSCSSKEAPADAEANSCGHTDSDFDAFAADERPANRRPVFRGVSNDVQDMRKTMSLFIFRNADRHSTGEAIFVGKKPGKLEDLLRILEKTVKPLVAPADSLFDLSLRPIRSMDQVQNGGTYVLKGKETLDPPPVFFSQRPALEKVRYKMLCEMATASQCEVGSRPTTSDSSVSTCSNASGMPRCVGGPPTQTTSAWRSSQLKSSKQFAGTWQAPDKLRKELTAGGKNIMPVHKRYDLWTALPRPLSEASLDMVTRSVWSTSDPF